MKIRILAIALFALTIGTVIYYPGLKADPLTGGQKVQLLQRPVVDVVFVLDTTGSMSGLIQTAKEKIWAIASTMASAQPAPEIRVGLVGYRDRGDAYVTKVVDLSSDLDSVYAKLMEFQAGGGGDGPESVNKALYDAVHSMSWNDRDPSYRTIFLVGDAPPHMDYNEVQYPAIMAAAREKGIVVNTIQCGNLSTTVAPWTSIASLGGGNFLQVEQSGSAVAFATPFDEEIAALSAKLDATRLYYGSREEKAQAEKRFAASAAIEGSASVASRARRGVFNAAPEGEKNLLGDKELVDAVVSGEVALAELDADELPASLAVMSPEEQAAHVGRLANERADIQQRIRQLAESRDDFIAGKVEEAGGLEDSLDKKLYETVREQAGRAGLEYSDGPAY